MVHAACWSHARRYFVDAVKLNKQDAASIRAVELMNTLFAIDAQARNEKMDHSARHALRHEKAPPLLDEIRTHILETSKAVLPSSAAGKACRYTLALWQKLTRFLDHPDLEPVSYTHLDVYKRQVPGRWRASVARPAVS